MNLINQLLESNIIQFGANAKNNPGNLEFSNFALGIANKNYPAKTPLLWNRTYEALGLITRNIRTFGDPKNAPLIFKAFKNDPRYIGGDVGVGFKDRVLDLMDELEPLANMMGAINVVVKTNGLLKGYNTDGAGYADSLEAALQQQGKELKDCNVVLLGAGGTTNAIAFALADRGAKLVILNRTVSKADELAFRINDYFGAEVADFGSRSEIPQHLPTAAAVVSIIDDPTSPLDQFSAIAPIELPVTEQSVQENHARARELMASLPKELIISDVMLRENDTATIALAKEMGFPTLDGVPMVTNQAIEAFWLVNETVLQKENITKDQIAKLMRS